MRRERGEEQTGEQGRKLRGFESISSDPLKQGTDNYTIEVDRWARNCRAAMEMGT